MGWKTKEQQREYNKKYYLKNKEKKKKDAKKWVKNNPEKRRIIARNWSRRNNKSTQESLSKSTTWKGRRGEMIALKMLKGSIDLNKNRMNNDYDLMWNNKTVDVKTVNIYKRKNKRGKPVKKEQSGWWNFGKGKNTADYYFCICLVGHIPSRYYLIPKEYYNKGVCIGYKSKKYDKFKYKTP